MEEKKTDWRKYRKSTHLASADLDAMETDKIPLIFTIKDVKFETGIDVSGTKMDGIFCYFIDTIKPLKLNSTNNKILAGFAKKDGLVGKDCHIIENWKGMRIELFVDGNVKMMGAITDGVRIKPLQPTDKVEKPIFTTTNFESAKTAKATIEQIKTYITSQDSFGDVIYNLSEENIEKANAYEYAVRHIQNFDSSNDKEKIINDIKEAQEIGYLKNKNLKEILEIIKEYKLSDGDEESLLEYFKNWG